jgi:hypothetical protein
VSHGRPLARAERSTRRTGFPFVLRLQVADCVDRVAAYDAWVDDDDGAMVYRTVAHVGGSPRPFRRLHSAWTI